MSFIALLSHVKCDIDSKVLFYFLKYTYTLLWIDFIEVNDANIVLVLNWVIATPTSHKLNLPFS